MRLKIKSSYLISPSRRWAVFQLGITQSLRGIRWVILIITCRSSHSIVKWRRISQAQKFYPKWGEIPSKGQWTIVATSRISWQPAPHSASSQTTIPDTSSAGTRPTMWLQRAGTYQLLIEQRYHCRPNDSFCRTQTVIRGCWRSWWGRRGRTKRLLRVLVLASLPDRASQPKREHL